jgi:DNA-binding transcriptional MerR regulator
LGPRDVSEDVRELKVSTKKCPPLRIGAFAARTGLSRDTIRFYERRGLLRPRVDANGYRSFGEADVERALGIQMAQGLGFTLEEIARTAASWDARKLDEESRVAFMLEKVRELEVRVEQLQLMRDYLLAKIAWLRAGSRGAPPELVSALTGPRRRRVRPARSA